MSYFGAKVLHAGTIGPAVAKSIPIVIKNSFNPTVPGTLISRRPTNGYRLAKGISSVADLTLLTLRGRGMIGVRGTAERLFRALASEGVNVILSSQASSEHTICFAVSKSAAATAVRAVTQEFRLEFQHGLFTLDQKSDQAIIAVVGEGMKGRPDVAGKVFGALGRHNINISAIAQGASERNISCVVDAAQQARALNVIHQGFFEKRKSLGLVVVGVGNIGGTLLRQLCERRPYLLEQGFDAKVIAVANSKRFVIRRDGIDLGRWREELDSADRRMDPRTLAHEIAGLELAERGAHRLHGRIDPSSRPIPSSSRRTCTSSRRTSARTYCRGDVTRRCESCWRRTRSIFSMKPTSARDCRSSRPFGI